MAKQYGPNKSHVIGLRLSDRDYDSLKTLAIIEGVSIADVLRLSWKSRAEMHGLIVVKPEQKKDGNNGARSV